MLKLMKYEFRKQLFTKFVIFTIALIFEGFFLFYFFRDNANAQGLVLSIALAFAVCVIFFESIECISTYSNDLKTKQSYMLFMTPHSTYTILGAKVLTMIITIAITAVVFFLGAFVNVNMLFAKYDTLSSLYDLIKEIFKLEIDYGDVVMWTANTLVEWIAFVVLAFFAITLSATFLANKKGKGLLSVAIYLVVAYLENRLTLLIIGAVDVTLLSTTGVVISTVCSAIYTILAYIASAYMLDRKVSL